MPFPANYGGVIDVYYKLYWLKKSDVKIHLHCFTYGRKRSQELESLCEKVYYYERNTGILSNLSLLPYTVKSRQSKQLEYNLLSNNFPILFEVLHTCYLMSDARFKNRRKIYRHSNIEHEYYFELSKVERNFLKRMYLKVEAIKLKRFESILNHADAIAAVNRKDADYFESNYPKAKTIYLPSFHQSGEVTIKVGNGDYLLFHGNLSIPENYESLMWLLKHVFCKVKQKVIVAGLNPPKFLMDAISQYSHLQLLVNPSETKMMQLITDAQAHVLYTAQPTGLKLKLLNVLFSGRFVICNSNMISGTSLKESKSLFICENPEQFIEIINQFAENNFSDDLFKERQHQLLNFDNQDNAKKLIELCFPA